MRWLHRLQQRAGLTKYESIVLVFLSALLGIGLVARHVQQRAVIVPVNAYEEMDRMFFDLASGDSARADTVTASDAGPRPADARVPNAVSADGRTMDSPAMTESLLEGGRTGGPSQEAPRVGTPLVAGTPSAVDRVDVNTATQAELEQLPRIGPRLAERIVLFRTTYGPFRVVEDLTQVNGIGARTVEVLRPHVVVSDNASRR